MKKLMLAATLAALTFGFAQAANVSWGSILGNTTTATGGQINLAGTGYTCGKGETKTYAVIVTGVSGLATGDSGINTLLAISAGFPSSGSVPNQAPRVFIKQKGGGDDISTFKYQIDNNLYDFDDMTSGSKPGMENDETAALAMTIARGDNGAGTITFYLDGTQIGTASFGANENALSYIVYGQDFNGKNAYTGTWEIYAANGTVAAADITVENIRANVIPEPTALALLALGVAGVALRRRVA